MKLQNAHMIGTLYFFWQVLRQQWGGCHDCHLTLFSTWCKPSTLICHADDVWGEASGRQILGYTCSFESFDEAQGKLILQFVAWKGKSAGLQWQLRTALTGTEHCGVSVDSDSGSTTRLCCSKSERGVHDDCPCLVNKKEPSCLLSPAASGTLVPPDVIYVFWS